jgi:ubiquinone/menaquinone biosynthesis C-methylase UbiE
VKLSTRVLLVLDRISPRPRFPDRPTPEAYAAWEYAEAEYQLGLVHHSGVSLDVGRVLDIGCGLGGKTVRFSETGARYVLGLDRSHSNIRSAARFTHSRVATHVEFGVADGVRLPLRDATFDIVITTDTFEHLAEPEQCLEEMTRVLRPGGRLIAIFGPFGSPLGSHLYDTIRMPWCHVVFSRDTLAEALREIEKGREGNNSERSMKRAQEKIEYFDHELNRMSLRRFRGILQAQRGLTIEHWKTWMPPRLRLLRPLLAIPGLDELLTGLLVMVAKRTSSVAGDS